MKARRTGREKKLKGGKKRVRNERQERMKVEEIEGR